MDGCMLTFSVHTVDVCVHANITVATRVCLYCGVSYSWVSEPLQGSHCLRLPAEIYQGEQRKGRVTLGGSHKSGGLFEKRTIFAVEIMIISLYKRTQSFYMLKQDHNFRKKDICYRLISGSCHHHIKIKRKNLTFSEQRVPKQTCLVRPSLFSVPMKHPCLLSSVLRAVRFPVWLCL